MPVDAAGTVQSTPSTSQTSVEVGASRAYPSTDTHSTSFAPCPAAQRKVAMLTAYERVLAPPSSHGEPPRASTGTPSVAVITSTPVCRCAREAAAIGATVAYAVTGPPSSGPRV